MLFGKSPCDPIAPSRNSRDDVRQKLAAANRCDPAPGDDPTPFPLARERGIRGETTRLLPTLTEFRRKKTQHARFISAGGTLFATNSFMHAADGQTVNRGGMRRNAVPRKRRKATSELRPTPVHRFD